MPSREAATYGRLAEEAAARKYGLERVGNQWYDAYHRSNGRKVQIKACRKRIADGQKGRFRFWQNDHKLLKEHQGSYVLVLYVVGSVRPIRKIWKVSPHDVDDVANWGPSQHAGRRKNNQAMVRYEKLL